MGTVGPLPPAAGSPWKPLAPPAMIYPPIRINDTDDDSSPQWRIESIGPDAEGRWGMIDK